MASDTATTTALDEKQGEVSMDFLHDEWLKDIIGPLDFQFQPHMFSTL